MMMFKESQAHVTGPCANSLHFARGEKPYLFEQKTACNANFKIHILLLRLVRPFDSPSYKL